MKRRTILAAAVGALTRRRRLRRRLADYRERLSLAWDALRGERLVREDDLP